MKILVPTDFSENAQNALDVACQIVQKSGHGEIHLLHVVEPVATSVGTTMPGAYMDPMMDQTIVVQLLEQSKDQILQLLQDPAYRTVKLIPEVAIDRLATRVGSYAQEQHVDLIVMGTKGVSGLEALFIGSNAEKIVRHAKCPVLTIHRKEPRFDVRNIVFATDCKDDSGKALEQLTHIQKLYNATIHLFTVNTPGSFLSSSQLKQRFDHFLEKYPLQNYTINTCDEATEEAGILYFARQIDADLIALVTHKHNAFYRMINGSIAEDIVNHAIRPVLTINVS